LRPHLNQLLEEQPDNGLVLAIWGRIQGYDSIDVEDQISRLIAAVDGAPNEPLLYRAIASLLRYAGQPEKAIEWVDRGIAIDPLDSLNHLTRGYHLNAIGELDQAQVFIERALYLNPDHPSAYGVAATNALLREQYSEWFALLRQGMDVDRFDPDFPSYIALQLYGLGLLDEGDKYLASSINLAPGAAQGRANQLYGLLQRGEHLRARDLSEGMLRDGIGGRGSTYGHAVAAMVYVSVMAEIDQAINALTFVEELLPAVTSQDFVPQTEDERMLQLIAVLAQTEILSETEIVERLDVIEPRWDVSFPDWRDFAGQLALIAQARGQTDTAVRLALRDMERSINSAISYRQLFYFQALADNPEVATRLSELEEEAGQIGREVWSYIEEHNLQL